MAARQSKGEDWGASPSPPRCEEGRRKRRYGPILISAVVFSAQM